jgi:hypothetical protein
MTNRKPLADSDLIVHLSPHEFAPEVPIQVRRTVASSLNLPAEKLLPDDDLGCLVADQDTSELTEELEARFGVRFSVTDLARTRLTLRAVSELVEIKRKRSGSPSRGGNDQGSVPRPPVDPRYLNGPIQAVRGA